MFRAVPPRPATDSRARGGTTRVLATLLRERKRLTWSVFVVALGVAYLAGSLSLLGRVDRGLADLSGAGTERAPLVVEGIVAVDSPLEQVRQLVPALLLSSVADVPGVRAVDPRIEDIAILVDDTGKPLVPLGITERPIGANWPEVEALNQYKFVGKGQAPTGNDVVIDQGTARRAGLQVGDSVVAVTKTVASSYRVSGIVTLGDKDLPNGSSLALFETGVTRTLFDRGDDLNSIGIDLEPGADVDQVRADIERVLPYGSIVSTTAEFEQHRRTALAKSFTLITALLVAFAGIALAVGAFTVANSNALLFARRRQGFALLRLVGASPGQLVKASMIESTLVGLAAVAVGLPLGLGVGRLIESVLGSLGTPIPVAGPSLTPFLIGACLAVGIAVTVATSVLPALDAARVPPVVAVTRSDDAVRRSAPWWLRALAWGLVGAVAGVGLGTVLESGASVTAACAGAGAVLAIFMASIPPVLTGLVSATTRLLAGRSPALRSLVALRSRRARTRAAATTAALLMATLVVSVLSTISSSFIASVDQQVSSTLTADLVVDSGTFTRGGLPSSLVTDIRDVDGVIAVSGLRPGAASIGNVTARITAMSGQDMFQLVDLGVDDPPTVMTPDQIVLSSGLAARLGAKVGTRLSVSFPNATLTLEVIAISQRSSVLLGEAIVDVALLARTTPSSVDIVSLVKLEPAKATTARAAIESIAAENGAAQVLDPDELITRRTEILRGFEQVIIWMLVFSVGLAVIGVANTMQVSVNERRRELGLIRAVGASARQVVRSVMVEAAALSVVGILLGAALGIGGGYALVQVLSGVGLDQFVIPWTVILATGVGAAGLGLAGAALPAVRASGAGIMEAIGDDTISGRSQSRASRFIRRSRIVATTTPAPNRSEPSVSHPPGSPGPVDAPETDMPVRCYNCGNDPGNGEYCAVCNAVQIEQPVGMFSTRAGAALAANEALDRPARPAMAGTGLWSTGPEDLDSTMANGQSNGPPSPPSTPSDGIVDAAVIEDDWDEPAPTAPAGVPQQPATSPFGAGYAEAGTPAPPHQPAAQPTPPPPVPGAFTPPPPIDAPPPPPSADRPMEPLISPFSAVSPQPETAPQPFESDDRPDSTRWTAPWRPDPVGSVAPPAGSNQLFADSQPEAPPVTSAPSSPPTPHPPTAQPPTAQPHAPQPTSAQPPPAPAPPHVGAPATTFGGPVAAPPAGQRADGSPLGAAVARLGPRSQATGSVAFSVIGALLAENEMPLVAVQGWTLGLPTAIVLTTSRILVVSDRHYSPLVEEFGLEPGLTIFGRHVDETASITFQEGDRLVGVDQIVDVALAVELATTARSRAAGTGF